MKTVPRNEQVTPTDTMVSKVLEALKTNGFPTTNQRRTLVAVILRHATHFTAEDLLADLESEGSSIGRATVFRTLELLSRLGYLSRIPEGERLVYTVCSPGHHHHLMCSTCGQVLHLTECPAAAFLDELRSQTGYLIEQHHLDISGICPACQKKS